MTQKRYSLIQPAAQIIAVAFLLLSFLPAGAQAPKTSARKIMAVVDSFNAHLPTEKLYLHFDKSYYAAGDTIWFKAYLFQGNTYSWSPLSGLLYVELINDSGRVVRRMSFPAEYGISWGQLALTPDEVNSGKYTLYAYTNWMRNAGPSCFFHQHFVIGEAGDKYWLVKESHRVSAGSMSLAVQLNGADARPVKQKEIKVKVTEGKKTLYHDDLQTGSDGSIRTSFELPDKTAATGVTLVAEDKSDPSMKVIVPLPVNRPENIDVQFMPESGYLVAGLTSHVGFKAIGEDGKGVDLQGRVVDSHDKEIVSFASIHRGMGAFEFTPLAGETYTALVSVPGGHMLRYPLPAAKASGSILSVTEEKDSLHVAILFSPDMNGGQVYHLLGLARGLVCYAANFAADAKRADGRVSKSAFPSGIAHFTLFNDEAQPVNERIVFLDQQDNLHIDISSDKSSYAALDSIALHIQVKDKQQQPVIGTFSLAITDDAQVKADSLNTGNIISHLLLSTDLKGTIEDPAWYFSQPGDPEIAKALDVLMLTQGWVGYNWPAIFKNPAPPLYAAQPGFMITGRVTNLFNKPLAKAGVLLLSTGRSAVFRDTTTDEAGRFVFANFPLADSPLYVVQARNAKGKNFGIGLAVDEFTPPEIRPEGTELLSPWYLNGDSTLLSYVKNNYQRQLDAIAGGDGKFKLLKRVTVTARKGIPGSASLNGPGGADQVIDQAEIEKAGKLNLRDLLQKTVKGFRVVYGQGGNETYKIFSSDLRIVIDGVPLVRFGSQRETLEYLQASDIKGIEVMTSMRNTGNYRSSFLNTAQLMNLNREFSFIEITTFSGNGIFLKRTPGVYVYKPLPVTWPVQFYAPRYTIRAAHGTPSDLRATIHWQPNLVTDKQGMAETSFYAAGKATTYTVILQGSDMNGNIGFKTAKLVIGQ